MRPLTIPSRLSVLVAGLAILAAGTVRAQVATTELVPVAPRIVAADSRGINTLNVVPDNPAAMVWAEASTIGAGGGGGTETERLVPTEADQRSRFFGLRLHGGNVVLGAEGLWVERDANPLLNPPATLEERDQNVGLGVRMASWLALGVNVRRNALAVGGQDVQELSSTTGGLSLNLSDWFFLGYGSGQNELELLQAVPAVKLDSDSTYRGIAIRTGGSWRWYLEHFVIDETKRKLDGVEIPLTGLARTTTRLQTSYAGWVVGGATTDFEVPDRTTPGLAIEMTAFDLGYAPMEGLAVTLHLQRLTFVDTNPPPGDPPADNELELRSMAIAWSW